jgi:predicted DNA-binding transcriptional regulator AlpA
MQPHVPFKESTVKLSNNDFSSLNPHGFTRTSKAFSLFDLSPSTGYRLIKKGKFPKQIKVSEGVSSMRNCDLLKYSADPEKYSAGE